MGRAILSASQFCHVKADDIFDRLDSEAEKLASKICIADEPGYFAYGYSAGAVLWDFSAEFGTVCPICLCPIKHPTDLQELSEFRRFGSHNYNFLPGWLTLANQFDCQPIHNECKFIAHALELIGHSGEESKIAAAKVISSKTFFSRFEKILKGREVPPLRFNPRTNSKPEWYATIGIYGTEWRDGDIRKLP